jgi:hypothetical protein
MKGGPSHGHSHRLVTTALALVASAVGFVAWLRRRVAVLAHRAFPLSEFQVLDNRTPAVTGTGAYEPGIEWQVASSETPEHLHIKVTNKTRRDIEISHIWIDTTPPVHLVRNRWLLPATVSDGKT